MNCKADINCVFFIKTRYQTMLDRVLTRRANTNKNQVRCDDTVDCLKKRYKVFLNESMPVIKFFSKEGLIESLSGENGEAEVFREAMEKY